MNNLCLLAVLLSIPLGAITVTSNQIACNGTSGTTISCTLPSAPSQNNKLVLSVGGTSAAVTRVLTITETGVTWNLILQNLTQKYTAAWCGDVGASPSASITLNMSATITTLVSANIVEISSAPSCNALGGSATGFSGSNGTSGAPNSTGCCFNTPVKNEVAFSFAMVDTAAGFTTMTNGYTLLSSLDAVFIPAYLILPN